MLYYNHIGGIKYEEYLKEGQQFDWFQKYYLKINKMHDMM